MSPVPMAVPPMLMAYRCFSASRRLAMLPLSTAAKAWNSWPTVMGTASCISVRPILTISRNSLPLARNDAASRSASASRGSFRRTMDTLMAVG